jgi:DNA-binding transcriptional LysR family regulator
MATPPASSSWFQVIPNAWLKDSTMHARKLCAADAQLYASPAYLARKGTPRTPRDLDRHEWVVYRRKTELRLEGGGPACVVLTRGRIVCDDFTFLRAALVNGCGIGYLGSFRLDDDVAAGRLVRVLPQWNSPISDLWAVWPGPAKLPRKVLALLDTVTETLRTHPLSPPTRIGSSGRPR